MKNFNYFDFLRGEKITIREILDVKPSPEYNATYFELALHQTDEKVHICIKSEYAFLVQPNAILFYQTESSQSIGYTKWKNGRGPLGIKLPKESLNLDSVKNPSV